MIYSSNVIIGRCAKMLPLYCLVMACSLSCGSINGAVREPILLLQRDFDAMRKWSALYSWASFNQNTNPVMLIKHRAAKVFADVFYNVDFEPLMRVQWIWAICPILFLRCKKKSKGSLKLNSQSCQVVQNLFKYLPHIGKRSLFYYLFLIGKIWKINFQIGLGVIILSD